MARNHHSFKTFTPLAAKRKLKTSLRTPATHAHVLFSLLSSKKWNQSIKSHTAHLSNSLFSTDSEVTEQLMNPYALCCYHVLHIVLTMYTNECTVYIVYRSIVLFFSFAVKGCCVPCVKAERARAVFHCFFVAFLKHMTIKMNFNFKQRQITWGLFWQMPTNTGFKDAGLLRVHTLYKVACSYKICGY